VPTSNAHGPWWRRRPFVVAAVAAPIVLLLAAAAAWELRTSTLQARYFSGAATRLGYTVEPGPSASIRFPSAGPSDERLGYTRIPAHVERLVERDYEVVAQARHAQPLLDHTGHGYYAPYREKVQAGLSVLDCRGASLYDALFPQRVYATFDEIPRLVVEALAYIENRELLGANGPKHNPVLEPTRLGKALLDQVLGSVDQDHRVSGASTLATQLEKYRHSPDGRTASMGEKWRQIVSASMRTYLDGEDTLAARRRIVVDYVNSLPLGAHPAWGEVHGVGDGLRAWYGTDFEVANHALRHAHPSGEALRAQARFFRQFLNLFIAQRRPAYFFGIGGDALDRLADSYLRLLADGDVITPALRDLALPMRPVVRGDGGPPRVDDYTARKASNLVRTELATLLDVPRLYDLDRLDLAVTSSIDANLQAAVTEQLRRLRWPEQAKAAGLGGKRLLERNDPAQLVYSFSLYAAGESGHRLRVQADNLDQPFDLNAGAKLELGSTAKLRTLASYLEITAALHERYAGLDAQALRALPVDRRDRLSAWAVGHLSNASDKSLEAMLEAAMERRYSANPGETFHTGGGAHVFQNFDRKHDRLQPSVREALQESINLPFVRLMRDVVAHHVAHGAASPGGMLDGSGPTTRRELLARFADREGRTFVRHYVRKYRGKSRDETLELLAAATRARPQALAVIQRSVSPDAGFAEFEGFVNAHLPQKAAARSVLRVDRSDTGARRRHKAKKAPSLAELYAREAPGRRSLVERAVLARVHPLELWVASHLAQHPDATSSQVIDASAAERQQVYGWLFDKRARAAQESRIASLLEVDAFAEIQRGWERLGYPFDTLVPSYATALGSSGDRPQALAELMGIIIAGGVRKPTVRVEQLHFAAATPYDTLLRRDAAAPERVMGPEVAAALQRTLLDVVEKGTARRLRGAFGDAVAIGGKTGTGDNRSERQARGKRTQSRVINRTATFVFFVGERHFGTVTAYVPGRAAEGYRFTSALPVQILKTLAPVLRPLVDAGDAASDQASCARETLEAAPQVPAAKDVAAIRRAPRTGGASASPLRVRTGGGVLAR